VFETSCRVNITVPTDTHNTGQSPSPPHSWLAGRTNKYHRADGRLDGRVQGPLSIFGPEHGAHMWRLPLPGDHTFQE